jgi:hypothetical protein
MNDLSIMIGSGWSQFLLTRQDVNRPDSRQQQFHRHP